MKRIGIDARMLGPQQTGIGAYIQQLITRIPAIDPGSHYVFFLREPFFSSWSTTYPNVSVVHAPERWYTLAEQTTFVARLMRARLDVVHFPNFNVPLLYPRPFIVTIHDITPKFFHGHRMTSATRRMAFDTIFSHGITNASRVIAVSEHTKRDILMYFRKKTEDITVIYNGVDERFFARENCGTLSEVRARFGITKPYILYSGVWRNHKNIVGLVEAFHLLREQHGVDCQLVLGGTEHEWYPDARRTWERTGVGSHIIRTGFLDDDDLRMLYSHATAYVLPSFYEGFGLTGLEAMALGTPVAAARTTALPEVYGDAAHYFDPHEPADIARALSELMSDHMLRSTLIARGHERARRYSWDTCAHHTRDLYHSLLLTHATIKKNKNPNTSKGGETTATHTRTEEETSHQTHQAD